jgi:transcriptional regulator with XRE-family HTH domain
MPHTNYLRFHRKQWALSQGQLAQLVGLKARSVVSSYEFGKSTPDLRFALALQFVFGVPLEALYPTLSEEIEDEVIRNAAALDEACRGRNDATAARVGEFLRHMLSRASNTEGV